MADTKTCSKCKEKKPLDQYLKGKVYKGGLRPECKSCHSNRVNEWAKKNPTKDQAKQRKTKLKMLYGITPEQYDAMFQAQGGVCKICGSPPDKKALAVDHNHTTKKVRGLLCGRCNRILVGHHTTATAKAVFEYLLGSDGE